MKVKRSAPNHEQSDRRPGFQVLSMGSRSRFFPGQKGHRTEGKTEVDPDKPLE